MARGPSLRLAALLVSAKAACFLLRLLVLYVATSYGSRVSGDEEEVSGVAVGVGAGCCVDGRDDDPEGGAGRQNKN